jgi:hypothetical protein
VTFEARFDQQRADLFFKEVVLEWLRDRYFRRAQQQNGDLNGPDADRSPSETNTVVAETVHSQIPSQGQ